MGGREQEGKGGLKIYLIENRAQWDNDSFLVIAENLDAAWTKIEEASAKEKHKLDARESHNIWELPITDGLVFKAWGYDACRINPFPLGDPKQVQKSK